LNTQVEIAFKDLDSSYQLSDSRGMVDEDLNGQHENKVEDS
jgi:hypothetical protein